MTNRMLNPIGNYLLKDKEGVLMVGGTLEFFEKTTTTPLAVYSDPEQTVSLGSVLVADAFGLVVDFHLKTSSQYNVRATYSVADGGAVAWTRDFVFGVDSSTDDRLTAIELLVASSALTSNPILNSGCNAANIDVNGDVLTGTTLITSAFQEGLVVNVNGRATNATGGTLTRTKDITVASASFFEAQDVVTTNSASVVEAQFFARSGDCGRFVDQQVTFSVIVYHDVGSNVNYTITINKADSEDDYSSTTLVESSSIIPVTSGTNTTISFTIADIGDISNGLSIEISAACGVQAAPKDYRFTMPTMAPGGSVSGWSQEPADVARAGIQFRPGQLPKGYISEFDTIAAADTDHDITIGTGEARSEDNLTDIVSASAITKQIDANWAEGDDAGGFPSGVTLTASTAYYYFSISKKDGTTDAGFDDNASATNLLSDAAADGYVDFVGLGDVLTDSSSNISRISQRRLEGSFVQNETIDASLTWIPPLYAKFVNPRIQGAGGGGGGGGNGGAGGNTSYGTIVANGGNAGSFNAFNGASNDGGPSSPGFTLPAAFESNVRALNCGGFVSGKPTDPNASVAIYSVSGGSPGKYYSAIGQGNSLPGGGGNGAANKFGGTGGTYIYLAGIDVSDGASVTVTIGSGGSAGSGASAGQDGLVEVEY